MSIANKTPRTLVAAGTVNSAAGNTYGILDLRSALGGLLTLKFTNGATGPTLPCTATIMVAHTASTTPAGAAAGAVWKTLDTGTTYTGGTTNNAITEYSYSFAAEIMHLCVHFTGNTDQSVTVEAYVSEISSFV